MRLLDSIIIGAMLLAGAWVLTLKHEDVPVTPSEPCLPAAPYDGPAL